MKLVIEKYLHFLYEQQSDIIKNFFGKDVVEKYPEIVRPYERDVIIKKERIESLRKKITRKKRAIKIINLKLKNLSKSDKEWKKLREKRRVYKTQIWADHLKEFNEQKKSLENLKNVVNKQYKARIISDTKKLKKVTSFLGKHGKTGAIASARIGLTGAGAYIFKKAMDKKRAGKKVDLSYTKQLIKKNKLKSADDYVNKK